MPFYNYFQPALVLLEEGVLDGAAALRIGAEIVVQHAFSPDALIGSFMDMVRRMHVGRDAATRLVESPLDPNVVAGASDVLRAFTEELERRLPQLDAPPRFELPTIDYVGLFSRDKARARTARHRARRRRAVIRTSTPHLASR